MSASVTNYMPSTLDDLPPTELAAAPVRYIAAVTGGQYNSDGKSALALFAFDKGGDRWEPTGKPLATSTPVARAS